jgi:hypothetical protein
MVGHAVCMGAMRNACETLAGRKKPLGRPRCRWEDKIKMER